VGSAVVFGDNLDVHMVVASVQLVLDAEVREVDRLVEVREVVFMRPYFDVSVVAIRPPVAVWPPAIRLLEPFLILALELVLENDAADICALFTKALLFTQVRPIELDVVGQLPRPAHAGIEDLCACVVGVAAVGFQEVATWLRERQCALATVEAHKLR